MSGYRFTLKQKAAAATLALFAVGVLSGDLQFKSYRTAEEVLQFHEDQRRRAANRVPHRCYDRSADLAEVLFDENAKTARDFGPAVARLVNCFRTKPGYEPEDPYFQLDADNKWYLWHTRNPYKQQRLKLEGASSSTELKIRDCS